MRTILEDYLGAYENHFDLAYEIPRRAREIKQQGSGLIPESVARDDKPVLLALRELTDPEVMACISRAAAAAEAAEQPAESADVAEAAEAVEAAEATEAVEAAADAPEPADAPEAVAAADAPEADESADAPEPTEPADDAPEPDASAADGDNA